MSVVRLLSVAACIALMPGCVAQQREIVQAAEEPGMAAVRGGRFTMGRDEGAINERPSHKVEVSSFAMDRTEVSARDFAEFLNAAGNAGDAYFTPDQHATVVIAPTGTAAGKTSYSARPGYERHPANNVSWEGAAAYCRWQGKRLPTEAEWEKSARGPDKRLYPWGKGDPAGSLAQFGQDWQERQLDVLVPVDSLEDGASPYGMLNMAGNVLEWTGDWYRQNLCDFCNPQGEANLDLVRQLVVRDTDTDDSSRPDSSTADGLPRGDETSKRQAPPRNDPTGPSTGTFKVLRGGSWQDSRSDDLAATRRFWLAPSQRFPHTGFRCSKQLSGKP